MSVLIPAENAADRDSVQAGDGREREADGGWGPAYGRNTCLDVIRLVLYTADTGATPRPHREHVVKVFSVVLFPGPAVS